jgi:hypothetical protein
MLIIVSFVEITVLDREELSQLKMKEYTIRKEHKFIIYEYNAKNFKKCNFMRDIRENAVY